MATEKRVARCVSRFKAGGDCVMQKRLTEAAKKRLRAGRMLLAGKICAEAALAVGVARHGAHMETPAR